MKTLIAAAAIAVASTTAAFAASSALDVYKPVKNERAIDYTATAAIGTGDIENDRLGDGSPKYSSNSGNIDFTATSSVGASADQSSFGLQAPRLGDGSPVYR